MGILFEIKFLSASPGPLLRHSTSSTMSISESVLEVRDSPGSSLIGLLRTFIGTMVRFQVLLLLAFSTLAS